jgi:3-keto-disaccharide hydrolase
MRVLAMLATWCVVAAGCGGQTMPPPGSAGGSGGEEDTGGSPGSTGGKTGTGGAPAKPDAAQLTGTGGSGDTGGSGGATGGAGGSAPDPDAGAAGGAGGANPISDLLPGSTPIFDGMTLDGWVGKAGVWSVKDGAIIGYAQNGGSLLSTTKTYSSFRISGKANVLMSENHLGICIWGAKSGTGYGGCIVFVPPSGSIWDYGGGGEVRTLPYVWMGMKVDKHAWNQFEILADATTGTVRMGVNGHEFAVYKKAGRGREAVIGLQIHAGFSQVGYKDLAIEVDPKEKRLLSVKDSMPMP